MFSMLKKFGVNKLKSSIDNASQAIILSDLDTAGEVSVEMEEEKLDKISIEYQKAVAEYQREKKEADEIEKLFNQRMSAAEMLNSQLEAEVDEEKKSNIEKSLIKLLDVIEKLRPDVERELEEAKDAKVFMDDLKVEMEAAAESLKQVRSQINDAKRNIKKAEMAEAKAKRQEDSAKALAGIKNRTNNINNVLSAINTKADKINASAQASKMKADMLKPTKVEDDELIKNAMNMASGKAPSTASVADRLASLKR